MLSGSTQTFIRMGESGKPVEFHFCPACGSTVFWYPAIRPERMAIALGADFELTPDQSVHDAQKVHWITTNLSCRPGGSDQMA